MLSAGHVVWLNRHYESSQSRCAPTGAATLRLISANILFNNPDVGNLGRDLTSTDADVILLQEVSMENFARLRMSGLFEAYPRGASRQDARESGSVPHGGMPANAGVSWP